MQGLDSSEDFRKQFNNDKFSPARLKGVTNKWKASKWTLDEFLAKLGNVLVWPRDLERNEHVGAPRTFNQTIRDYVTQEPSKLCIFEVVACAATIAMQGFYTIPKPLRKAFYGMPTIGLSRQGSGVGYHKILSMDGWGAWYAQVKGSTTWVIRPAKDEPKDMWPWPDPDASQKKAVTCTLEEGDAIFVPSGYYRAWRGDGDVNLVFGFHGPDEGVLSALKIADLLGQITNGDPAGVAATYDKKSMTEFMAICVRHAMQVGHIPVLQKLHDLGATFEDEEPSGYTHLHVSALMGQAEAIRFAIARGALTDVKKQNDGRYPIHMAAAAGHIAAIDALVTKGSGKPWKYKDHTGKSALHLAVQQGHTAAIQTLVNTGSSLTMKDRDGFMPLHWAVESEQPAAIDLLISMRANLEAGSSDDETALYRAAVKGSVAMVKQLLDRGAKIESQSREGRRALHVAAYLGNMEMLKLLHKRGANMNPQKSKAGSYSPEGLASAAGHGDALAFLRSKSIQQTSEETKHFTEEEKIEQEKKGEYRVDVQPMHAALQAGHSAMLEAALKTRPGPGLLDERIRLQLTHDEITFGHMSMLEFLTKRGTDLRHEEAKNMMLVQKAARVGHTKVIDWLVNEGLDVNYAPTDQNGTQADMPLLLAVSEGHLPAVKLLLLLKADANHMNSQNLTAFHVAVMKGKAQILSHLLKTSGPQALEEQSGRGHLHVAAAVGHTKVVKALIDQGSDLNATDKGGFPPHFLAAEQGHVAVLKVLQERRASLEYSLPDPSGSTNADGQVAQASALSIAASKGHVKVLAHLMEDFGVEQARELAKRFGEGHGNKFRARLEEALNLDKREQAGKHWQEAASDPEKLAAIEKFSAGYAKLSPKERADVDRRMADKAEIDEAKMKYEKSQQTKRVSKKASKKIEL